MVSVNQPVVAVVAFAVFGAGLAPVVPSAFSAAGRVDAPGGARVLGRVATFGYAGSVLGPLAIGGLSQLTSVRVALVLPAALALAIAAAAGHLSPVSLRPALQTTSGRSRRRACSYHGRSRD